MELISQMNVWHWLILAGILLVFEMLLPVTFFLWIAIAAVLTAIITFIISDISATTQVLSFSVLCVLSMVAWKRWRIGMTDKPDHPVLNQRGHIYIGRTFTLEEPITNGLGKIRVDDSNWKIQGPELSAGEKVTVVSTDGAVLIVEAA